MNHKPTKNKIVERDVLDSPVFVRERNLLLATAKLDMVPTITMITSKYIGTWLRSKMIKLSSEKIKADTAELAVTRSIADSLNELYTGLSIKAFVVLNYGTSE
jgi:hypothetical protein